MNELTTTDVRSLAFQFADIDLAAQPTKSDIKRVERAEELIRLYLMRTSIDPSYTLKEQAAAMGVSLATVKRWAASELYQQVAAFMAPASSPMGAVGKEYIADSLLPLALREARRLLEDPDTKASTKAALIKEIVRVSLKQNTGMSEEVQRRDAMAFLREQGVSVQNLQIIVNNGAVPTEYRDLLLQSLPPEDIVDIDPSDQSVPPLA